MKTARYELQQIRPDLQQFFVYDSLLERYVMGPGGYYLDRDIAQKIADGLNQAEAK